MYLLLSAKDDVVALRTKSPHALLPVSQHFDQPTKQTEQPHSCPMKQQTNKHTKQNKITHKQKDKQDQTSSPQQETDKRKETSDTTTSRKSCHVLTSERYLPMSLDSLHAVPPLPLQGRHSIVVSVRADEGLLPLLLLLLQLLALSP